MPTPEIMPRTGRGTGATTRPGASQPPEWSAVQAVVRGANCTLATSSPDHGPHQVPVFAAWDGEAFFVAANAGSVKHRHLLADSRASLAVLGDDMHVLVQAVGEHVTDPEGLRAASRAFADVFDWPTTPVDSALDAGYGAPTSGGPPYQVWRLRPRIVFSFPTDGEAFAPTRWRF